ncbi:MAG TPA: apolipoprotein N-acyltransferase [Acidobacteriaceae bacterium]|nr:apolipoprotein N-acyltransferase [Acidobacteriaceae bacterium]
MRIVTTQARLGLAVLSAVLLNLCFPIAGPLPPWRMVFAWFGAVPLLVALLSSEEGNRPLWRGFFTGWVFGVLWYAINCYWIYQTMFLYGGLPTPVAAGILLLYSLIMGLYYGLFGWLIAFTRHATGGVRAPLFLTPFLWTAIDLLGAHLIKVPWDQLGYSQIDNAALTSIAPWTGTYGITFVLLAVNALFAAGFAFGKRQWWVAGAAATVLLQAGLLWHPAAVPTSATAVLLQENLSVQQDNSWAGTQWDPKTGRYVDLWDVNTNRFVQWSERTCTPYIAGMPETDAPLVTPDCDAAAARPEDAKPALIVWPEAESALTEGDPRFRALMGRMTAATGAAAIVGNLATDVRPSHVDYYNAASVFAADGSLLGRYAKIHLVPWGEYVPFARVFSFAHQLTRNAGRMTHGWRRMVFRLNGHHYGIFICYESIFGDEIRQFALNGAEVLVNISDDGWYGDTSAPWQHLNMARMRAVENRRWLLRDTDTGVTAAIDPYGRMTQSAPRHEFTSLAVRYGFNDDLTFYTRFGDVFALACGILSLATLARSVRLIIERRVVAVRADGAPLAR